ncbi:MAG TPA: hypothetical protein VKU93_07960, partial [Terracidiphilus sp.]|nr:hypothetical protein [Terracidiphilus sp.]
MGQELIGRVRIPGALGPFCMLYLRCFAAPKTGFILRISQCAVCRKTHSKFFTRGHLPMKLIAKFSRTLRPVAGISAAIVLAAGAQGQTPAATPAPAAQAPAAAPAAAPAPLSTFVLTGPLQWLPPATFDAGPLGKLSVNGIVTGFSQFQNNAVPGDSDAQATL